MGLFSSTRFVAVIDLYEYNQLYCSRPETRHVNMKERARIARASASDIKNDF